jgi:branched-chain amino acid aminotransferase
MEIDWDSLTFSFTATDVMYRQVIPSGSEWSKGELLPFGDITISPAAGVLNYGQGIFEGMKAQRAEDGTIVLFRPKENAARFAKGAERLGMPPVPEEIFIDAVESVIREVELFLVLLQHLNLHSWSMFVPLDRTSREE